MLKRRGPVAAVPALGLGGLDYVAFTLLYELTAGI
jgi:hypothetical protein